MTRETEYANTDFDLKSATPFDMLHDYRMLTSFRELGRILGRTPTIEEALDYLETSLQR